MYPSLSCPAKPLGSLTLRSCLVSSEALSPSTSPNVQPTRREAHKCAVCKDLCVVRVSACSVLQVVEGHDL